MPDYQLYCFAQSGHSYKAALMLNLIGADWAPIFVDYFNGETRSDAYRTNVNEMGEAPVLIAGDKKLAQSGVILTYLAEHSGRFVGENEDQRLEILRWILFDNHKLTSYLASYRYMHSMARSGDPAVIEFLKGRAKSALSIVDKHLGSRPFIAGTKPTIADLSMCGYLYFSPKEYGFDIAHDHPAIGRWLERIRELPGWAHPYDLMPGHPRPGA